MSDKASKKREKDARVAGLTKGLRSVMLYLFGISGIINILALTGAFYMMQVYDRVLLSGSVPTLALISLFALGLFAFQGGLDVIRSQILHRIGARFDNQVAPDVHQMTIEMPRYGFSIGEALERGRMVDTLRNFFGSPALVAMLDFPWMPIFVAFVFFLHPYLGALTVGGAVILTLMTIMTEVLTRKANRDTSRAAAYRSSVAEANARNADVIRAMGFSGHAIRLFRDANEAHLRLQAGSSDITRTIGAISKVLRMMLQSAVLGLGAYLTIMGDMTAGSIIAASVVSARALAPIDAIIGNWKNIIMAKNAFTKVRETVAALSSSPESMELPDATESFTADAITVVAPATGKVILADVSLRIEAGQALGLIGPSGGGKSSLLRAMAGVWPVLRGHVRLDQADLGQWSEQAISRSFGYLPQDYTLFDTTVARNIARLADPEPEKVIAAAKAAGVHDMIVAMPDGYETQLGANGTNLSGGQRQRIALACALYGDPFVVLLDEPNSNLDADGERAVSEAIASVRARGGIVIVVAHRPSALENVDLVGIIQDGALVRIGPKSEIMKVKSTPVTSARPAPAAARAEAKAVS
ncbi:type I secretion system permease/ATPase [Rhodobacteraceae bacterium N5(2021)]|uniref:Type I secretion system permease/ATPase n=1 Tax=Gymnodinialimonas phycosphaerae TaxID=2841589 RepID=A0A975YEN9_9RHOB|nr:type I secretion system permease/ATPase [Gymnodinialimonas phycosphaerae]MBY4893878.1 type I secretion system permease/ATPase [Gymnodinialimonas phycosphaerae]